MFNTSKNHEWIAKRLSTKSKPAAVEIASVMEAASNPIAILDSELCIEMANEPFCKAFRFVENDANGRKIYEYGGGEWDSSRLRVLLEGILEEQISTKDFEVERVCPERGRRMMRVNAFRLNLGSKKSPRILLGFDDVTAEAKADGRKQEDDEKLRRAEERAAKLQEALDKKALESRRAEEENQRLRNGLDEAERRINELLSGSEELAKETAERQRAEEDSRLARQELKKLNRRLQTLQAESKGREEELAELKKGKETLREYSEKLSKAEKHLAAMQTANEKLQHTVEELKKAQRDSQRERDELKRTKDEAAGHREALHKEKDEHLRTKGLCMTVREELEQAEGRIADLEEACERLRGELLESEKSKEKHREAQHDLMRKVEHLKALDTLTNVYNRSFLVVKLEEAFHAAKRAGLELSLLILDLDSFRKVNKAYGLKAGDSYLKALADLVVRCLRPTDIVVRYEGDKLALVLPLTPRAGAEVVAKRLQMAVTTLEHPHGDSVIRCTASIGVAPFAPASMDTVDQFVRAAEGALKAAKSSGPNSVSIWSDEKAGEAEK